MTYAPDGTGEQSARGQHARQSARRAKYRLQTQFPMQQYVGGSSLNISKHSVLLNVNNSRLERTKKNKKENQLNFEFRH